MPDTALRFLDACQPFGYPLLACSVLLLAAIFYHLLRARSGRQLARLQRLWHHARAEGKADSLLNYCRQSHAPLATEILHLSHHKADEGLTAQAEARLRLVVDADRAGMATISVITNVAPMLGILGTAWGLVGIFGVFGTPGAAQEGIAAGISTALYTTIFGLAIAVPGIIALTCFERALERRAARINAFFTDLLTHRHLL